MATRRWVLATGNAGKLRELQTALDDLGVVLVPQSDYRVPDVAETGLSFVENALIKARHAARLTGLPALADDSGLEVDALDGAPGIFSARFAGHGASDAANRRLLLDRLADTDDQRRGARFYCALVRVRHADDPTPLIAEGAWPGRITRTEAGDGGFGYDPVFFVPELGCTAAELTAADKARHSHRARALAALRARLLAAG